jgi:hypothetical protein
MTLRWPITRARRLGFLPDRIKPSSALLGHVFMLGRFTCGDLTAYMFGVATGTYIFLTRPESPSNPATRIHG